MRSRRKAVLFCSEQSEVFMTEIMKFIAIKTENNTYGCIRMFRVLTLKQSDGITIPG